MISSSGSITNKRKLGGVQGEFLYFSEESSNSVQKAMGFCWIGLERIYKVFGRKRQREFSLPRKIGHKAQARGPNYKRSEERFCSPRGRGGGGK